MSRWTHSQCERCWFAEKPGEQPCRLTDAAIHTCCWCGAPTVAGIFRRMDPDALRCGGEHESEDK